MIPPPYLASSAIWSKSDLSWEPWDLEPRPGIDTRGICRRFLKSRESPVVSACCSFGWERGNVAGSIVALHLPGMADCLSLNPAEMERFEKRVMSQKSHRLHFWGSQSKKKVLGGTQIENYIHYPSIHIPTHFCSSSHPSSYLPTHHISVHPPRHSPTHLRTHPLMCPTTLPASQPALCHLSICLFSKLSARLQFCARS